MGVAQRESAAARLLKGYCTKPAKQTAVRKECHLAAIKKNNMKDKTPTKIVGVSK
ncbi:MAG: hypothetical protein K2X02_02815 [Alphaproteobacteria bacterium]|nr:hypothetical protein [Alphaproteobacteria bacterium]